MAKATQEIHNDYIINLSDIYESLPNQEWSGRHRKRSKGTPSVHLNEVLELTGTIWEAVRSNADSAHNEWADGWTCLNYFIAGERGCGKSTFLRYIAKCLTNSLNPMPEGLRVTGRIPSIYELFFCDPTAMHSNESFFVDIIAAFERRFAGPSPMPNEPIRLSITGGEHEHSRGNTPRGRDGSHSHNIYINTSSTEIREQIRELATGVNLMFEKSTTGNLDPVTLLRQGMLNSTCAHHLKRQFDSLVNTIAETYHIDAFLICIDDADIESMKNTEILEAIRSYLTHPRIIILFTGDPSLTNEAIRKKQFSQFGKEFHEVDGINRITRWGLVDNMTAQYLKKIFPVSNHYALPSLYALIQQHKPHDYRVLFPGDTAGGKRQFRLVSFISALFLASIVAKESDAEPLVIGFLQLPTRSIMHTLRNWNDRNITHYLEKNSTEDIPRFKAPMRRELARIIYESFRNAFFSELQSQGFTRADIEDYPSTRQTCWGVLRHCAKNKDRRYSHHLATFAARYYRQESALFLTAKAACAAATFGDVLAYSIYAIFTIQAFRFFQRLDTEGKTDDEKYEKFSNYLHTHAPSDAFHWSRKLSLVFISQRLEQGGDKPAKLSFSHGVVLFENDGDNLLLGAILQRMCRSLDKPEAIAEDAPPTTPMAKLKAYLLLIICLGRIENRRNAYYFSPYHLLGFILKCQEAMNKVAQDDTKKAAPGEDKSTKVIGELLYGILYSFIAETTSPIWEQSIGSHPYIISKCSPVLTDEIRDLIHALAMEIKAWIGSEPKMNKINAKDMAELGDSIYHFFCEIGNSIESHISGINFDNGKTTLSSLFALFNQHIKSHTFFYDGGKKPKFKDTFIEYLKLFPLIHHAQTKGLAAAAFAKSGKKASSSPPAPADAASADTASTAPTPVDTARQKEPPNLLENMFTLYLKYSGEEEKSALQILYNQEKLSAFEATHQNLVTRIEGDEAEILRLFKAQPSVSRHIYPNLSRLKADEPTYRCAAIAYERLFEYLRRIPNLQRLSEKLKQDDNSTEGSGLHTQILKLYGEQLRQAERTVREYDKRKEQLFSQLRQLLFRNMYHSEYEAQLTLTKGTRKIDEQFGDILSDVSHIIPDIIRLDQRLFWVCEEIAKLYKSYQKHAHALRELRASRENFCQKVCAHPALDALLKLLWGSKRIKKFWRVFNAYYERTANAGARRKLAADAAAESSVPAAEGAAAEDSSEQKLRARFQAFADDIGTFLLLCTENLRKRIPTEPGTPVFTAVQLELDSFEGKLKTIADILGYGSRTAAGKHAFATEFGLSETFRDIATTIAGMQSHPATPDSQP